MWTVSRLAQACGLSRTTILYYESIGLLRPAARTAANYRRYSDKDVQRLQQICAYRNAGLKLTDIAALLDRREDCAAAILQRRLVELDAEIERIRGHQRAIIQLLKGDAYLGEAGAITKERWTRVMAAAGMSEDDMWRWHAEFETSAPLEHQQFLEFLRIPGQEIAAIRQASREAAANRT